MPATPAVYALEPSDEVWLPNFSSSCWHAEVRTGFLSFKGAAATNGESVRLSKRIAKEAAMRKGRRMSYLTYIEKQWQGYEGRNDQTMIRLAIQAPESGRE